MVKRSAAKVAPLGLRKDGIIKGENGNVKGVYDLQGRRVETPTNGVYIVNGKKILIK